MSKPELTAPAGSLETLRTAVTYGADAVYIGSKTLSLRAKAKNFTIDMMAEGISFARERGVRVYVAANAFARDRDIDSASDFFTELKQVSPDALIISDPGLFALARKICPEILIHISTQANTTNALACRFWHEQGAKRVVLARELSLEEILALRKRIPAELEIEAFVHGAMCMSYSGRCLLSGFLAGQSANSGKCTQPCRWEYALVEKTRPKENFPIEEDEDGTFILSSRDMCMIRHLPALCAAGIDSFKIEGRMKSALYIASAVRAYRNAIDDLFASEQTYQDNMENYLKEVTCCTYRPFCTGFYFGSPAKEDQLLDGTSYLSDATYIGLVAAVLPDGSVRFTQKNKFSVGDRIEIMKPSGENVQVVVRRISDLEGNEMPDAPHAGQELQVCLDLPAGAFVGIGDILRA